MDAIERREEQRKKSRGVVSKIGGVGKNIKGRPKTGNETKSPVTLMLLPSLYQKIKDAAHEDRKSVSTLVAECIERYLDER